MFMDLMQKDAERREHRALGIAPAVEMQHETEIEERMEAGGRELDAFIDAEAKRIDDDLQGLDVL